MNMNELQTVAPTEYAPVPTISANAVVLNEQLIQSIDRIASIMASGKSTVPAHLQGKPGDCFAVCLQAMQWQMNPFAVAQKTHFVNGAIGYEAQLVIAVLNASPALANRLDFTWSDNWKGVNGKSDNSDDRWCEVSAILKGEAKARTLRVSMAQVGSVRNSPNWQSDPRQQLAYLTAKRWARLNCPDVILGVYTPDELEQPLPPTERDMGKVEDVRKEEPAAANTRANRIKDKLSSRSSQVVDVPATDTATSAPGLDEVLGAIGAANTKDELAAAGAMAARMADGPDKDRARHAYSEKIKAGKAAAAAAADKVAEPAEPAQPAAAGQEDTLTYDQVLHDLQHASTADALNLAADLIKYVPDLEQQDALRAEYERLRDA